MSGDGVLLVYDRPWNQEADGEHVFRVDTLADAAAILPSVVPHNAGRVALDVDGVLADIHQPFVADFNTYFEEEIQDGYGDRFTTDDITDYPFSKFQKAAQLDTKTFFEGTEEYPGFAELVESYWTDHERVPPVEDDFPAGLHALNNAVEELAGDYAIDIVTATYGQPEEVQAWLASYGIEQDAGYERFIHSGDKHELEHTVYIDDNPSLADVLR